MYFVLRWCPVHNTTAGILLGVLLLAVVSAVVTQRDHISLPPTHGQDGTMTLHNPLDTTTPTTVPARAARDSSSRMVLLPWINDKQSRYDMD